MADYALLVTDEAEEDINDAAEWYGLVDSGLESQFVRTVEACLESIKRNPQQYPLAHNDLRRALLRKFPYGVFYFIIDDTIIVQACFHTSRNPNDWQNRV